MATVPLSGEQGARDKGLMVLRSCLWERVLEGQEIPAEQAGWAQRFGLKMAPRRMKSKERRA